MPLADLQELVEALLADDIQCLDLDDRVKVTVGDSDVRYHLPVRYGITDSIKVQELEKDKRTDAKPSAMSCSHEHCRGAKEEDQRSNEIIISCLELGTGLRQLSRLTGVTYGVINKLSKSGI